MNIFSFFENWDETLLPSIIVYYLVFNFITQKHNQNNFHMMLLDINNLMT